MLSFSGIHGYAGDRVLFQNLNFSIKRGKLICLTGPNGSGKTTLFLQIRSTAAKRKITVRFLYQVTVPISPLSTPGIERAEHLFGLLEAAKEPDLVLLDEPGNHMDAKSFDHFTSRLRCLSSFVLIITHERRLLRMADHIHHLEDGVLCSYGGNWDEYMTRRAIETKARQAEYEFFSRTEKRAQKQMERTVQKQLKRRKNAEIRNRTQKNPKAIVNKKRNQADKTLARFATTYRRLNNRIAGARQTAALHRLGEGRKFACEFFFEPEPGLRRPVLEIQALNPVFRSISLWREGLSLQIFPLEKWAVVGNNGSGKSTLLSILAGEPIRYEGAISCCLMNRQMIWMQGPGRVSW